jgi:hypothetical protein
MNILLYFSLFSRDALGFLRFFYFYRKINTMKTKPLLIATVFVLALSSCQKDLATDWIGTYTGVSGSTFSRVVVTKVSDKAIRLDLQTNAGTTYATVANGKLKSESSLVVDEDGTIAGASGMWHFSGAGNRDGNELILNGTATQTGSTTQPYTFTGTK